MPNSGYSSGYYATPSVNNYYYTPSPTVVTQTRYVPVPTSRCRRARPTASNDHRWNGDNNRHHGCRQRQPQQPPQHVDRPHNPPPQAQQSAAEQQQRRQQAATTATARSRRRRQARPPELISISASRTARALSDKVGVRCGCSSRCCCVWSACRNRPCRPARRVSPLPHDAYIWQRLWTPQVIAAAQRRPTWCGRGACSLPKPTAPAIGSRSPFRGTPCRRRAVRSSPSCGSTAGWTKPACRRCSTGSRPHRRRPPPSPASRSTTTARPRSLSAYARFLAALRARLPAVLKLSITALPTWMNSPALERLAPPLDELVLQVHAVDDPRRGLFDPAQAERWVHAFARRIAAADPGRAARLRRARDLAARRPARRASRARCRC